MPLFGFSNLLNEENLSQTQKEYVGIILSSSRSLLLLIDDILDFSKIEANKLTLDFTECRLKELLNDIDALFRTQIENKGLAFTIDCIDVPSTIHTDGQRLRQCLVNLLGNANKFTSNGSISIRVYQEESYIRFDVEDTSIGIPQDKQHTIFEAFTQADSSTSRRYGGTGLGLTITVKLITLMGGTLSLTSEPKKGSTFSIRLPVNTAEKNENFDEPVEISAHGNT